MQPLRHESNEPLAHPRTLWTRGKGCAELAEAVAPGLAIRAEAALLESCIENRAQLLVTKRVPSSAPLSSATPIDFAAEDARRVVALVSGGPHSQLAAQVAGWLGRSLGVPAELVSGYRVPDERDNALDLVERTSRTVPELEARIVEAWTAKQLLEEMHEEALLVFGAAGGSWIQRMFLGPGARLAATAPVGAVVVREQPAVVFQMMEEPVYVSPLLSAADALLADDRPALPVVDDGLLVGVIRRAILEAAGRDELVQDLMDEPRHVAPTDAVEQVGLLYRSTGMDPVPVTDDDLRLVGVAPGFD